jgi:tetratricopeptide (TPR) repeat protein
LCLVQDDDSVERREVSVQRRFERSCACTRCVYEASAGALNREWLTGTDATRLGHYYFSNNHLDRAKSLYQHALRLDVSNSQADLWHALGAIELSLGNFLDAQRIWKKAAENEHTSTGERHEGIALQLEKIQCYGYLRDDESRRLQMPKITKSALVSWHSVVPKAFVTPGLVDESTCRQIIQWAESGQWTQHRHYAVPTHDVPVHSVPPLLAWFNNFMTDSICPLLATQFDSSPNYFCHDAFCVRYKADGANNHLSIHTDESTHSFILALNDDFRAGGTYFYDRNQTVSLRTGDLLSFRGDQLSHGGEPIATGTRYILAVFLYHDDDDNAICNRTCSKRPSSGSELGHWLKKQKEQNLPEFSFGFQLND